MRIPDFTSTYFCCLIFFIAFGSKGFSQTIDLSKPVGTTAGQAGGTATGGASYVIPIDVLKGTNGMEPKINLAYNSQGAEGIAGFGWNLSAYSIISRQGKRQYYSGIIKKETYAYNSLNDNISTAVSSDGLTTTFNYDGFGNIIKTTLPDGNIIMNNLVWESATGRYSRTSYRYSDNGMWNKTYFDLIGRKIRKESKGFNNQLLFATTSYNSQGLLYKQTQPQYSSEATVEVTNTYDQLQRLTSVTNGSTTSNYSYSLAAGGLFTTTITNGASQSSSKTIDASGKVIKTNDNGGQLNFSYDS